MVVQDIPDGGQDFPGDGYLYLHLVLASYDSLVVTELVEIASLCLGRGPRALYQSFSQISVAMRNAPRLDLTGTFFVSRLQPAPGYKVGGILE